MSDNSTDASAAPETTDAFEQVGFYKEKLAQAEQEIEGCKAYLPKYQEALRLSRAYRDAVMGWREYDWPAGFCRRTAEMIAENAERVAGPIATLAKANDLRVALREARAGLQRIRDRKNDIDASTLWCDMVEDMDAFACKALDRSASPEQADTPRRAALREMVAIDEELGLYDEAPQQADQADVLREALKEAYRKGASDVHNYWVKNPGEPPRGDPEFGEAASDYAEAALDILDISARSTKAQEG